MLDVRPSIFLALLSIAAVNLVPKGQAFTHPSSIVGEWVLCDRANELLGFSVEHPREGSAFSKYPARFKLTFHTATKKQIDERIKTQIGENVFHTDNVRLMQWNSDLHQTEEWETTSFLVWHDGKTSLYSSVPYAVIYGGNISLINGASRSNDLLVINFNSNVKERTPDTVVYQRQHQSK